MALHVLAYNLTRVMNIMGIQPLWPQSEHSQSGKTQLASQPPPRPRLFTARRFDTAKTLRRHSRASYSNDRRMELPWLLLRRNSARGNPALAGHKYLERGHIPAKIKRLQSRRRLS